MGYFYIFLTIVFTVYGQLILKWRLTHFGGLPETLRQKLLYFVTVVLDPYVFSGFFAAFIASLTWIAALTKLDLSHAYPFMSLSFICVLVFSYFLFGEPITYYKLLGTILIMIGLYISVK